MAQVIPVVWLSYDPEVGGRNYWDMGMLEDIYSNRMWRTGYDFEHYDDHKIPDVEGAVIIFPARNQVKFLERLNEDIAKLKWVVLMLTGDEEAAFPVEDVKHDNIEIWVMSPRPGRHDKYHKLGTGYPPQLHKNMPEHAPDKDLDYFFAGQVTHERRKECANILTEMDIAKESNNLNGEFLFTEGFTQGFTHAEYFNKLSRAKVAPAPSGPETPDSFRLFEALEAGCMPIADTRVPKGDFPDDYWTFFFDEIPPFPVITEWEYLPGWTRDQIDLYPSKHNRIQVWWLWKKRAMALKVKEQIQRLSGVAPNNSRGDQITILMPSSPNSRHPSTEHIEQCVRDVRVQLPDSEIIIMVDGIRPEQAHLTAQYDEYKRKLLWLCTYKWNNVIPLVFDEFGHQSTMTRKALEIVKTPFILFVEHDTPLVPDFPIEWETCCSAIESGAANIIRFSHESHIIDEHKHLFIGGVEDVHGAPLIKTIQYSQRPHLASAAYYRHMMQYYVREGSKAFIEHAMYGQIVESYNIEGLLGWNIHKLWLYYPDTPGNIQRSYDLNSRGDDQGFDSIL